MMSLLLSLIIGVAAFNIVASLVMVVTDKTTDIAVLRTLGMSPGDVVRIFFIQGAVIGWFGVLLGIVWWLVARDQCAGCRSLSRAGTLGFQIMPGDVYYVSSIPSILEVRTRRYYFCRCLCTDFACYFISGEKGGPCRSCHCAQV